MMKVCFLLLFSFLLFSGNHFYAQYSISKRKFKSDFVLKESRVKYLKSLDKRITETFGGDTLIINEKKWDKLLYEVSVDLIRRDEIKRAVKFLIAKIDSVPQKLSIRAILTARALYPKEFESDCLRLFKKTKRFETAVYSFFYLYKISAGKYSGLTNELVSRFGKKILLAKLTLDYVQKENSFPTAKQLKLLFSKDFLPNETVVYVLLRHKREIQGLTIIRKPDGSFVRKNDSLLTIRQLAYSVTDFPYFLLDGNTPQGLFKFNGFYRSKKKSIGPTPIPILRMPFETSCVNFCETRDSSKSWSLKNYLSLFQKELRKTEFIKETFYAGKLGRKLLVAHGSTDDKVFYETESYFPLTPSTGCITSYEKWDEQTGKLIESDQLKLVNAILSTGRREGYFFVLELNDKQTPVTKDVVLEIFGKRNKK